MQECLAFAKKKCRQNEESGQSCKPEDVFVRCWQFVLPVLERIAEFDLDAVHSEIDLEHSRVLQSLDDGASLQETDAIERDLQRLDIEISELDETSDDWISNKAAADLLGVKTETVANHRNRGEKLKKGESVSGLHDIGCFWRKRGNAHPKYYLPRMIEHAGHLVKIYPRARLDSLKNRH